MSEPSTETAPQTERTVKQNPHSETLRAAFPGIDVTVINAVLVASSNNIEKAFDALLGMSDPDYRPEPLAHTVSPQPVLSDEQEQQIRMDELFARQLATQNRRVPRQRAPSTPPDEQERSFLDDDLPILKENIIQGFNETKVKVGSFINNLRAQYTQRVDGQVPPGNSRTGQQQPDSRSLTQYDHDALVRIYTINLTSFAKRCRASMMTLGNSS